MEAYSLTWITDTVRTWRGSQEWKTQNKVDPITCHAAGEWESLDKGLDFTCMPGLSSCQGGEGVGDLCSMRYLGKRYEF